MTWKFGKIMKAAPRAPAGTRIEAVPWSGTRRPSMSRTPSAAQSAADFFTRSPVWP